MHSATLPYARAAPLRRPADPVRNDIGIACLLLHGPFINQKGKSATRCARECCANVSRTVAEMVSGERGGVMRRIYGTFFRFLMPTESESRAASSATQSAAALAFKYTNVSAQTVISHANARIGKLLVLLPRTEFIPVTQFRLLAREFVWVHLA